MTAGLYHIYDVASTCNSLLQQLPKWHIDYKSTDRCPIDCFLPCLFYFTFYLLKLCVSPAPAMMFPTDLASDMTTLIGPINGTLWNGASIIPGVTGTAFYTVAGAGYLDLGIHPGSGCLYCPDDCPDGISIALWLKIYELPSQDPFPVVINNGGCRLNLVGYCLFVRPDAIGFIARHRIPGSLIPDEGWNCASASVVSYHSFPHRNPHCHICEWLSGWNDF